MLNALRASKDGIFDEDGLDDSIRTLPGVRRSSKESQASIWHQPVLCCTVSEPHFYLKSMMKDQDNYHKTVAKIHLKMADLPIGKRIITPPVPTFCNSYNLALLAPSSRFRYT